VKERSNLKNGLKTSQTALCFLLILLPWSLAFSLFQGPNKSIEEGNRLYEEGQFEEALKHYGEVEEKLGKRPEYHHNKGNIHYRKGAYPNAQDEYLQALQSSSRELKSREFYNLGNTLFKQGKLQEAIEAYKESLIHDPEDTDAKYNMEIARQLLQRSEEQSQQEEQEKDSQKKEQEESQQGKGEESPPEGPEEEQAPIPSSPEESEQKEDSQAPRKEEMTEEEAERILDALRDDQKKIPTPEEKEGRGEIRVEKDW